MFHPTLCYHYVFSLVRPQKSLTPYVLLNCLEIHLIFEERQFRNETPVRFANILKPTEKDGNLKMVILHVWSLILKISI